jgi:hypothetical protein
VEIMLDKVILDHKKSYLVSFEDFNFFLFLAKIDHVKKITKKQNFQNRPFDFLWNSNMTFYDLKLLYLA